jgi:hypothetical protein
LLGYVPKIFLPRAGFDEDIEEGGALPYSAAVGFSEYSLYPIALDGVPDLAGNQNGEPVARQIVLAVNKDKATALPPPPFFEQLGYFAFPLNLLSLAKPQLFWFRVSLLT